MDKDILDTDKDRGDMRNYGAVDVRARSGAVGDVWAAQDPGARRERSRNSSLDVQQGADCRAPNVTLRAGPCPTASQSDQKM